MKLGRFVILVIVSLATLVGAASGDVSRVRDRRGDSSARAIDIKWVQHGHRDGKLLHTVRTYRPWRKVWLKDWSAINFTFDRKDGRRRNVERVLVVVYRKGRLVARMGDVTSKQTRWIGRGEVRRPNGKTLKVLFERRLLGRHFGAYDWGYTMMIQDAGPCDQVCSDSVPELGSPAIRHRLQG